MNLMYAEVKKNLNRRMLLIIFSLLCFGEMVMASSAVLDKSVNKAEEKVILKYQEKLLGKLTEQKKDYIETEKQHIESTEEKYHDMQRQYLQGELSHDEYETYLNDYNACENNKRGFQYVYTRYQNIKDKAASLQYFVYDKYWCKLFQHNLVLLIEVVCLLLLSCNVTAVEYAHEFQPILYATKNGRKKVFYCKVLYSAIAGIIVSLLFSICSYMLYKNLYVLPQEKASAASIKTFMTTEFSMSLLHTYWLLALLQALVAAAFCVLVVWINYYIGKNNTK